MNKSIYLSKEKVDAVNKLISSYEKTLAECDCPIKLSFSDMVNICIERAIQADKEYHENLSKLTNKK